MNVQPWWKRWPDRLDWELEQFDLAGMRCAVRDSDDGVIHLDVLHTVGGVEYELVVSFPDLYPYFRPIVTTPSRFNFHQEPFNGGLCLAARDPEHWSTEDSAAGLIANQLPLIVQANADDDAAREIEEHAPEPVGPNYAVAMPDFVLIDSAWKIGEGHAGTLDIGTWSNELPLRAAVLRVRDESGATVAEADPHVAAQFQGARFSARWVRLADPVLGHGPNEFVDELRHIEPEALSQGHWVNFAGRRLDLLAVIYSDEIRYLEYGDDWTFLLRIQKPTKRSIRTEASQPFLIRALRAGQEDLTARVPALGPLRFRKVAVVGLGALGAPIAIALARAGIGSLSLVDHDFVDPGTLARWPHGLRAAGNFKVDAVAGFIQSNWPYTTIDGARWRLGDPGVSTDTGDAAVLTRMFAGVDAIVDATANTAANHAIADLAWEAERSLVVVSATAGACGGLVARLEAGRTACWRCFNLALGREIPLPPADESSSGRLTPIACSDVTFIGAGFDLTPLADEAVRIVSSRLCEDVEDGYPAIDWDVETLALRTADGRLCPPTWTSYVLAPRAECSVCARS